MEYTWHKIAEDIGELNFPPGCLIEVEADGKKICLALHNNKLFACSHKCPHAGGVLADGYLDPRGNIVCPVHRYKFNPANGHNVSGEGYFLKTFPVEVRPDGVFIGLQPVF